MSFRYTTQRRALELKVSGWVRNESDGSVKVTAEADRQTLDTFLEFLHQGPRFARVDEVEQEWTTATGEFKRFQIW